MSKAPSETISELEILTVAQVAARLQIPVSSIYERTRFRGFHGTTPVIPHRRVGKYLRFVASEVDSWFLALPQPEKTKRRYRRAQVRS
jgi:predicted DNA-binding transcriptional regulator AlpA